MVGYRAFLLIRAELAIANSPEIFRGVGDYNFTIWFKEVESKYMYLTHLKIKSGENGKLIVSAKW